MRSRSKRKVAGVPTSVIPTPTADPAKDKPGLGPGPDPTRPDSAGPGSGPGPGPGPDPGKPDQPSSGRGGARPGAGRPPKVPAKIPEFTKAGLARLWQLAFGMIAVRKDDDDWQIDDEEAGNLAEATDPVLRQYLPLVGDHAALMALGITLALTVAPRMMLDRQKRKAKSERTEKTEKTDQDRSAVKIMSRTRSKAKGPKAG